MHGPWEVGSGKLGLVVGPRCDSCPGGSTDPTLGGYHGIGSSLPLALWRSRLGPELNVVVLLESLFGRRLRGSLGFRPHGVRLGLALCVANKVIANNPVPVE